jgi:hypothetical protein
MPIDPRIPLMGNPLQIEPQGNVLARVMAMRNTQSEQALRQMQMQETQARWQQMQQERAQQAEQQQRAQSYLGAINSNAGPARPFNPAEAAGVLGIEGASKLGAMIQPKADEYKVVGGALVRTGPAGVQEVYKAPSDQEKIDPNKPFMIRDGQIVPNPAYQEYAKNLAGAGAAKVTVPVNLGQKGFDNTLKLRGDFRSEPVYKAHQEVQAAHAQITQSLKQASPAGDLAGATKIMKILDPGSVVRESELGMAMAATGLLDRVQNKAQMILSGEKLTPAQRKDFQLLADTLAAESAKQYNAKRGEYEGIAQRNQLNVADVIGPTSGAGQVPTGSAVDSLVEKYKSKGR